MAKPVMIEPKLFRLPAGWYWTIVGPDAGEWPGEQLESLKALGAIRVARTTAGLWSVDEPGQWTLFEVPSEAMFTVFPGTRGPFEAPKGEDTTPADVGQEWEAPKGITDAVVDGAKDAADATGDIVKAVVLGAGIIGAAIFLAKLGGRR